MATAIEVRADENGDFDELIVATGAYVHVERMSKTTFWMRCERGEKDAVVLWFNAVKTKNGKVKLEVICEPD